ncbi:MAG: hypothetical protein LAP85_00615 [Acidobacteriia bacterium]|nr:hypothetical protein [Terriglobia bacterium]
MPDAEIKRLMRNLEEAINETLSESSRINESIRSIDEAGYEAFLIIDATIGFNRKGKGENEVISSAPRDEDPVRLRITSEDAKFLKSLKIAVEIEG